MKLVQTVPNYSIGTSKEIIEQIVQPFRETKDVKLLDYSSDADHNRSVVTVIGEPEQVKHALIASFKIAKDLIDMRDHKGQHPRMGFVDVVPFIPIKDMTIEECDMLAVETAKQANEQLDIGFFYYEHTASAPHRLNLSNIRKGQYEGMADKVKESEWTPDVGMFHPTTGITAIGARMPLVAFNVLLDTSNLDIATAIGKAVRHLSGGLRYVKALGIDMPERGITQVSMNLTDYTKTPIYRAFELIKIEAKRYGVNVIGSEVIGLVPMDALIQTSEYYLGIENLEPTQILERHLME